MCASPDKKTTEAFRKRRGSQRGYKVINKVTARPYTYASRPPYHPGRNVDRHAVKTYLGYKRGTQRGFHCLLNRSEAVKFRDDCSFDNLAVVCVSFDPVDVIAVEAAADVGGRIADRQIVVRALHISERAWKQAGLPVDE